MKKILTLLLLTLFIVSCSKDEPYSTTTDSIIGTWKSEIKSADATTDLHLYYSIDTYAADNSFIGLNFNKIYPDTEWRQSSLGNKKRYLLTGNYLYFYDEKGELVNKQGIIVQIKGDKMIQTVKRKNPVTGKDEPDIITTYYKQ